MPTWKPLGSCLNTLTNPPFMGKIAFIYREDKSSSTDKEQQVRLLSKGMSVVHSFAVLSDVPVSTEELLHTNMDAIPITQHKLEYSILQLPDRRTKGFDQVLNDLIKIRFLVIGYGVSYSREEGKQG